MIVAFGTPEGLRKVADVRELDNSADKNKNLEIRLTDGSIHTANKGNIVVLSDNEFVKRTWKERCRSVALVIYLETDIKDDNEILKNHIRRALNGEGWEVRADDQRQTKIGMIKVIELGDYTPSS